MTKLCSKIPYYAIVMLGLTVAAASCSNSSQKSAEADDSPLAIHNTEYADTPFRKLTNDADTLLAFDDLYPVDVRVSDRYIAVHTVESQFSINIYDRQTRKLIWETGREGNGPEDVLYPDFFASVVPVDSAAFQMIDVSDKSHIYLDVANNKLSKTKLPKYIGFSSSVNMMPDYTVAAKNQPDEMFYIYSNADDRYLPVGYDLDLGDDLREKLGNQLNYYLSAKTYADQKSQRIIVPHFFFDEYSVYDFSGKLLKKISLSDDSFDEKAAAERILNKESYIGYTPGFATEDACYLYRVYQQDGDVTHRQLVKTDWDGNPEAVYALPDNMKGGVAVDKEGNLYGFVIERTEENEIFYLVKWKL